MRIIRGILKSRRISAPKNFPSRPTTDFAKEGLFNVLENKYSLYNLNILDLCAGTGNISLEFASREAGIITAVDQNYNCVRFIKKTVSELGMDQIIDVYKADARDYLRKTVKTYDLIFADPPYDVSFHSEIAQIVLDRNLLSNGGILIIEHGRQTDLSTIPYYQFTKQYGNVYFSFIGKEFEESDNPA